jgi:hypothetical protein
MASSSEDDVELDDIGRAPLRTSATALIVPTGTMPQKYQPRPGGEP